MKRLTERDEFGNADIIALSDIIPDIYAALSSEKVNAFTNALNLLADYEDTGLQPEEIMALLNQPNEPLTLDELRAHLLHGHPHEIAPLYVVFNPPMPIDYASRWRDAYNLSQLVVGQAGSYGKTWLAYRRKPEVE